MDRNFVSISNICLKWLTKRNFREGDTCGKIEMKSSIVMDAAAPEIIDPHPNGLPLYVPKEARLNMS
jgi:hypothetical protein